MAYSQSMIFIETPIFTRLIVQLLDDDEYSKLQVATLRNWDQHRRQPTGSAATGKINNNGSPVCNAISWDCKRDMTQSEVVERALANFFRKR
jgi:hypothetical protein